jgi:hypothetical protein
MPMRLFGAEFSFECNVFNRFVILISNSVANAATRLPKHCQYDVSPLPTTLTIKEGLADLVLGLAHSDRRPPITFVAARFYPRDAGQLMFVCRPSLPH